MRDLPRGYETLHNVPVHRGLNHCPHCFCAPCVVQQPPTFLQGSCDPHPANAEKRHRLYKLFWRCLNTLGVWQDEEYLTTKELRTARDDRRDIMPRCVIEVRKKKVHGIKLLKHNYTCRKFEDAIQQMTDIIGIT